MINVIETADGWVATCSECAWSMTQQRHVPTKHRCKVTGEIATYVPPGWFERPKERPPLAEPSLLAKAVNFSKAAAKHVAAGRPIATDEQVAERWAICQACEIFKPKSEGQGVCTHKSCGCALKAVGLTGKNKLRWADSVCPLEKWQPLPPAPPAE